MHNKFRQYLLVAMAQLALAVAVHASEWQFDGAKRIVAIADIHGAYEPMVAGLQQVGVIDDTLAWSGADAHLVIVGDILDRGPGSRNAMDLLMRLEGEAADAGGKVHVLIGNHEAMNLVGDLRYVSAAEYAAFADEESAEERQRWFEAYVKSRASGDESVEALRTVFGQRYPAGFFAHRRAFSSNGKYGEWLLSKPVVVVINGTAFVHGGLSPMIGEIGLDGTNGRLRGEMLEYVRQLEVLYAAGALLPTDNFHDHPELLNTFMPPLDTQTDVLDAIKTVKTLNESNLYSLEGPLWYRGNVVCSELIEQDKLDATLEVIGATRVVIGHTPTPGRAVLQRLDGHVIEIDTGMLNNYYGGKASVLIIDEDAFAVVTEEDSTPVAPLPHPRAVGARPGGSLSASKIEALLSNSEVVSTSEDEQKRTVVTLSDGERTIEAFFSKRAGRGFYPEAAAYRLDLLLELEMVPVAVKREIDGIDGTLQFRPQNWIDEMERSRDGTGGSAWCPLSEQWNAMFVFDVLTYNAGRSGVNLLYNLDMWQLMLIDHSQAFVAKKGMPPRLESVPFFVGQAWKSALSSLTDDVLQEQLGDVLDKRRLHSLAARRDELLERP
ncbi:MAG: metallophosphoesterase [Gammaproteobacteria bacterium]|nr:metallophosphoesterase [Gammaproteobacteria bacterium]MDH3409034.1 metallophosphoesterase [Gammaproteobacteria bacterium]MDH3551070.1 metallophosphoesterase [Gammaproteobacteria bacterium]